MEWKFQLGLVKPWGNFSSVYRDEIFSYNHNSVFTLLRLIHEMKSHHGLTSWNFNSGWNSPPYNRPSNVELFAKIISNVRKRLHLRCLTGFWKCLCCVRDNYLYINFPTQPFLLPSCLWWFKAFFTFPISHETHTPAHWQQNRIGKVGDIFQSFPTYLRDRNHRY